MTQKKWGTMERQLLERMIGAIVLLVALVLIVPAILDGSVDVDGSAEVVSSAAPDGSNAVVDDAPLQSVEIRLDQPSQSPPQPSLALDQIPVRSVEKAPVTKSTEPSSSAQPVKVVKPPPPVKPVTVAEAPAEAVSTPKPKPKPKPEPKPELKPPVQIKTGWIVQLGSFSSRANAQGLADRAQAKGFAAYLTPLKRSGKTLYRVRVGPPQSTRDKAAKRADDLRRAGFTGQVAEQVAGG